MPKVSVCLAVYKTNPEYLKECIESILNQTYSDFEFLIVDDCPEDKECEKIIQSYKDERIKYYRNEKNLGISGTRNRLLDLATGEYIAVMDHDDISLPKRFEKEVAYLDSHPECGVVSANIERFPKKSVSHHPEMNLDIKRELMHSNIIAHTAMMIRKSILDKDNIRYEEDFSPAEDYQLVLRLIQYTMFYNIQEILVKYRFLENNTTNKQWDKMCNADALCRCFASKEYPYLFSNHQDSIKGHPKYWVRLFDIIPFIKVIMKRNKSKYLLFGFIPLFSIRRR